MLAAASAPASADVLHPFDASTGEILIHTDRGGLLGFAGHRHRIRAERFHGTVTWSEAAEAPTALEVGIDATSLVVTDDDLDPGDVAKVQADMEGSVLETDSFPAISFVADAFERKSDRFVVTGRLDLHGVSREISFPLAVTPAGDGLRLSGELRVRQSDHDIRRVSAGLGTVKVKDEVRVEIRIDARPPEPEPSAPSAPLDAGDTPPAR